ncbi:MAG: hypothetical protein QG608_1311 [Actinomycetota bacterium]|nr:hypothetical protein [Actinomycetota bacterium]
MTTGRTTAIEATPQERRIIPRRPAQAITLRSVQSRSEPSGSHEDGVPKDRLPETQVPETHVCAGTALGYAIAATVAGLLLAVLLPTFLLARVGLVLALIVTVWVWASRKLVERFRERNHGRGRGVLRVGVNGGAGVAARMNGRWLLCPAGVVHRALGARGRWHDRPEKAARVALLVPVRGRRSEDRSERLVWARVTLWGPALPGHCDLVVLRSCSRLPSHIGRVRVSEEQCRGDVRIVLPEGSPEPSRSAGACAGSLSEERVTPGRPGEGVLAVSVVGGRSDIVLSGVCLPEHVEGAPVSPKDSKGCTTAVAFLLTGGRTSAASGPPEATVVGSGPAQDLMKKAVTRRLALQTGISTVLTGCAGGVTWWFSQGEEVVPLRGAGWRGLFLTGSETHSRWSGQGLRIDSGSFQEISGYESIRELGSGLLRNLDFVTCPNQTVTDALQKKASEALGRPVPSTPICRDSMVVLAEPDRLRALCRSGILVRVESSGDVYFDLARYVNGRCANRWSHYDKALTNDAGSLVTLHGADPAKAAGGQNLLQALVEAWDGYSDHGRSMFPTTADLWRGGPLVPGRRAPGPLGRGVARSSSDLLSQLVNNTCPMIYTYEHDALRTIMNEGHEDFLLFRTIPECRFTQSLLTFTDRGKALADALGTPQLRDSLRSERIRVMERTTQTEEPERRADRAASEHYEEETNNLHATMRHRVDKVAPAEADEVEIVRWSPRILAVDGTRIEQLLAQYALTHPA